MIRFFQHSENLGLRTELNNRLAHSSETFEQGTGKLLDNSTAMMRFDPAGHTKFDPDNAIRSRTTDRNWVILLVLNKQSRKLGGQASVLARLEAEIEFRNFDLWKNPSGPDPGIGLR